MENNADIKDGKERGTGPHQGENGEHLLHTAPIPDGLKKQALTSDTILAKMIRPRLVEIAS